MTPPYNTGNGDFPYNDRFSHSAWLTFIQNRLFILKKLLSPNDGIICVQCDDNEQAYLKVLMDDVFGRDHFLSTIAVQMSQPTGFKMKHENVRLPKIKEFVLVYKMNPKSTINVIKKRKDKWDNEYKNILLGVSKDEIDYITKVRDNNDRTKADIEKVTNILKKAKYESLSSFSKSSKINIDNDFLNENVWRIVRTVSMPSQKNKLLAMQSRDKLNQTIFPIITPRGEMYIIKGDFDESVAQPRLKIIFASDYLMENVCDLWTDIKTTGLDNEGVVKLSNGKKPEMLMQRLIEMFSNKNDLVLDAFAGTGTTGAVAHKLHRRFITLEQLNTHVDLTLQRLTKVLDGDQSGISKDVDWQGGGSFVYAELMEKNQGFVNDLQKATNIDELNEVYQRMKISADFDFRVDLARYENDPDIKLSSFDVRKKILIKMLDKNRLYYNKDNLDDADVRDLISDSDYQFNSSFYGKELK